MSFPDGADVPAAGVVSDFAAAEVSYIIVECSSDLPHHHGNKYLRSNIRTEPSAPTLANTSVPFAKATSNTSLSCAISCVFA